MRAEDVETSSPDHSMLRRWVEHAFAQGWVCVRSRVEGSGHVAHDEYAKSSHRPTLDDCLAWVEQGGNVEVLLHESNLFQVDAEAGAPSPWGDPDAHAGACLSRSAGGGLHAIYVRPDRVEKRRWIKKALWPDGTPVPLVDLLTKGVWPLPGCRRTGGGQKAPGEWTELGQPVKPCATPQWVIDAIPQRIPRRAPSVARSGASAVAWAIVALSRELAAVAGAVAGNGRAHTTMMSSGARLGQIVGGGYLDREYVVEQLVAAGLGAGWEESEARRCANDAVEFGSQNPRGPAELPEIEIMKGAAADPPQEVAAETGTSEGLEPSPGPAQEQVPDEPEHSEEFATLDDALALLDHAVEADDPQILFRNAKALAALPLDEGAIFLQEAKEAFERRLAKTDLADAIADRRKAREKEIKAKNLAAAQARRATRIARARQAISDNARKSCRQEIELYENSLTRDPKAIHDDAVASLDAGNSPEHLFIREGRPARIGTNEEGEPVIEHLEEKEMQAELIRRAIFVGRNRGGEPQPVDPPPSTIRTLLGCGDLPFPKLTGIVRVPVFRPDGTILASPGYDKATGLFHCVESGLVVPPVSKAPSPEEIREARDLILEIFCQFPFVGEASRANAVALLLTTFVQPIVDDHRPLAVISAREAGTGKGLIAESCARVATGRVPKTTRLTREEEFEKKISHLLAVGSRFILIDNAKRRLESETLESALTLRLYGDRTFGHNDRGFEVRQDATWCATGNNIELGTEIARRSYLIELNAEVAHPEDRAGPRPGEAFKRLPEWVARHRGRLIWAALTIGRAWWAAGHPPAKLPPFGNFERWQGVIGGLLEIAGIPDFLGNRKRLRVAWDEENTQWSGFLREAWKVLGGRIFQTNELASLIERTTTLQAALPDELIGYFGKVNFTQMLGVKMRQKVERRFGTDGLRINRLEDERHEKVGRWQLEVDEPGGSDGTR